MRIHPGGFRVVLAGAKVSRLLPFLQTRGFNAEAFIKGNETMARLRAAPCHLLLFELECGDMMGVDLARGAKIERLAGATLLVDDPMKSGMIIAALSRGIDSYVSLPPDETVFLDRIEGLLLQQWGLVVTQQQQGLVDELAAAKQKLAALESSSATERKDSERRLREQLADQERASSKQVKDLEAKLQRAASSTDTALKDMTERHAAANRRVVELTKELGLLRDQLATMHLVAGSKSGTSDEGPARFAAITGHDDDDDDGAHTMLDPRRAPAKKPAVPTMAATPAAKKPPPPPVGSPPFTAPKGKTRPGPVSGVGEFVGDATDDFQLADLPSMPARPSSDVNFDESTQAIPAALARALLDDEAAFGPPTVKRGPATTRTVTPPGSVNELSDFLPPTGSFGMENDARTRAMSSPMGLELDDLQALATSANSFGDSGDFDARTMAVPADVLRANIAAKKPPPDSFFFDEATPAAGVRGAPTVPGSVTFNGNDDNTAPRGIDTATVGRPPPPKTRAGIDSDLMRDASRIPSIGDEEVMFLDDD